MKITTQVLPMEQIKFIKQIDLNSENNNQFEITAGFILYERIASPDYRIKEREPGDDFAYLLSYPRPEDHPNDYIDELILQAAQSAFPRATMKTELLFTTTDVQHYEHLKSRPFEQALLTVQPDFAGMDIEALRGKPISIFNKQLNVYVQSSSKQIKNLSFRTYCAFEDHERIFDKLDEIVFL